MECYLPAYTCETVITPFKELGLKINYFHHEDPLKALYNKDIKNSVILFIDYFGTDFVSNKEIQELLENDNIVIMDLTHSILDKSRFSIKHDNYYLIASLRKIFPIPDGGIVYYNGDNFKSSVEFPINYESKLEAMLLRYFYINKMNMGLNVPVDGDNKLDSILKDIYAKKPEGFKGDLEAVKTYYLSLHYKYEVEKMANEIIPQNIPFISLHILNNISFSNLTNKRFKNLKFIYENLNKDLFLFNYEDIKSPFLLPLKFESESEREYIKNILIKNYIYPPIRWDIEKYIPSKYSYEHELSKIMLTLPIDQRYEPDDLSKAVDILNQAKLNEK
jgi:phage pi2 protein 07